MEFIGYNQNPMRNRKQTNAGSTGKYSYDGKIAHWWRSRAQDSAHQRAYRKIADFIRASFPRSPRLIIDYACGAGNLLSLLSHRFARSKIVGLDGSAFLLGLALRRISHIPRECSRRISLIHTPLPNLSLMRGRADLVLFCFPNMMPGGNAAARLESTRLSRNEREIARRLSIASERGVRDRKSHDSQLVRANLEYGRCISQNLRQLLVQDGICVRVEYANTKRHEWSSLELQRVGFEEGSLDVPMDGLMPRAWFRVLASSYFRSRVMDDVYQQTGDKRDRNGGYLVTVLRAL
jgi:SAM-dependent methyltransferase